MDKMAQDTSDEQPEKKAAVCECGNVVVPGGEAKKDDIVIKYPDLSLWRPDEPEPTPPRRRDSLNASRSRSPSKTNRKATLTCLVCRNDIARTEDGTHIRILLNQSTSEQRKGSSSSALLDLAIPSEASTFGAPSRPGTPPIPTTYLPPLPDPFFLPPPFTPAHPFFHSLARESAQIVISAREKAEEEIREFVQRKRLEVEAFEKDVRGRVEYLWDSYEKGHREFGVDSEETATLGKLAIPGSSGAFPTNHRPPSFGVGTPRPQINNPSPTTFGGAGSLLSASLSTHGFFPQSFKAAAVPPPTTRRPSVTGHKPTFEQNSITMPYQHRKSGIDLDLAASLRVSNMSDLYSSPATGSQHNRPDTHDRRYYDPGADVEDPTTVAERSPSLGRREKIERAGGKGDIELQPFAESSQVSAASSYQASHDSSVSPLAVGAKSDGKGEEEQLRTPRGRAVKPIGESISPAQLGIPREGRKDSVSPAATVTSADKPTNGRTVSDGQVPMRKKVTFEEPNEVASQVVVERAEEEILPSEPEDAVFDFEEHDTLQSEPSPTLGSQQPLPIEGSTPDADKVEAMRRNTQLVENKLIDMVAADAPSHRAAWRNHKDQLWSALGRYSSRPFAAVAKRAPETDEDDDSTSWGTSILGTSAPIQIQRPVQSAPGYMLEPKTSLVERSGVMVPPLRTAMRRTSSGSGSLRRSSGSRPPGGNNDLPADIVSQDAQNLPGSSSSSDIRRRASGGHAAPNNTDSSANSVYNLGEKRMSFAMDPGPALEMDDDEDAEDMPGAVNFVPPHRQLSQDRDKDGMGEAGWRSLA